MHLRQPFFHKFILLSVSSLIFQICGTFSETVYKETFSGSKDFNQKYRNFCSLENWQNCLSSLQSLTNTNNLAEVASHSQLLAACRSLKDSLKCADLHMSRCFGETEIKVYNHVLNGAREFIRDLCIPGKVQEDFLKHGDCLKNISKDIGQCSVVYEKLLLLSENADQMQDVEKGLKRTCCTFRNFVQCKSNVLIRHCGTEAVTFFQVHLDKISDPLIHEHCSSLTYTKKDCYHHERDFRNHAPRLFYQDHFTLFTITTTVSFFYRYLSSNLLTR